MQKFIIHIYLCLLLNATVYAVSLDDNFSEYSPNVAAFMKSKMVIQMMNENRFDEVEKYLASLQKQKEQTVDGTLIIDDVCGGISASDELTLGALKKWREKYPSSHFAFLLSGWRYINLAWDARGDGFADTVSEKNWVLFKARLLKAKLYLDKACLLDAADPLSITMLIEVAQGLSYDYDKMEEYFTAALKLDPAFFRAYREKASYLDPRWHGENGELLAFAKQSVLQMPENSVIDAIYLYVHDRLAQISGDYKKYFSDDNNWREVEKSYEKIIQKYPKNAMRRIFFAHIARRAGKPQLAVSVLNTVILLYPKAFDAYRERADAYVDMQEWKLALEDYYYLIQNFPEGMDQRQYYNRALCLYKLNDFEQAKDGFLKVLEADDKNADAYYYVGWYYYQTHQQKKAAAYFEKALEISPDEDDFLLGKAFVLNESGKPQAALPILKKLAERPGAAYDVFSHLGYAYLKLDQPDLAKQCFLKALSLKPGDAYAKDSIKYIEDQKGFHFFKEKIQIGDIAFNNIFYAKAAGALALLGLLAVFFLKRRKYEKSS